MWKWRLKQKLTAAHSDLIWYFYDIWQPHKAALFQRTEGEDSDCLELALKSYLHVHLIKMTGDTTHMRESKKKQKKIQISIISKWKWRIKKPYSPTTWQNTDIIFPIFPSGLTRTDDLSAGMKRHSNASNLNSESIILDGARSQDHPDLTVTWEKTGPTWQTNANGDAWSISLERELELRPPTGKKCNQHKVAGFAVLLGWDSWLNVHQVLKHESYLCKCFSWKFSLEDAHTIARDGSFAGAAR